jgi:hypothetical protein
VEISLQVWNLRVRSQLSWLTQSFQGWKHETERNDCARRHSLGHRTVMRGPASEHLKWRTCQFPRPSLSARRATCTSGQAARPRARSFAWRPSHPAAPSACWPRGSCLAARTHWRAMPDAPGWCEPLVLSVPAARHPSIFGMNSGATQRAVELAAADPANRAQLGRRRELGERRRPKKLPRRAAFEHEPESAAARGVSGARGTTRCAARPPGDAQR